jgi:uncharacterized protein YjdB
MEEAHFGFSFPGGVLMKTFRSVLTLLFLGFLAGSLPTCAGSLALNGIVINPANPSLPVGTTLQLSATAYLNDQTNHDATGEVTWSSSDTSVATVSTGGLVTALAPGTTTISASSSMPSSYSATGSTGTATLTVNSASLSSLAITPADGSVPVGVTQQLTATGTFSDGTSHDVTGLVTWSSSDPSVATISTSGLATGVALGRATVTATFGALSGSTTLTVNSAALSSLSVAPANPSIPAGVTRQFTATGSYSDGTSHDITGLVAWGSSNPSVATISTSGLATAVAAGTSTVTATSGSISGGTTLTVNSATLSSISIAPGNPSIPIVPAGITQQLTATGNYSDGTSYNITPQVTWGSSNGSVATISTSGLATAVAAGTTTITATSGGFSGSTLLTVSSAALSSITVTPLYPRIPVGATQQFIATGAYSDGTSHDITGLITWTSGNTSVATIGTSGLATAVVEGQSLITAAFGSISGTMILTVGSG